MIENVIAIWGEFNYSAGILFMTKLLRRNMVSTHIKQTYMKADNQTDIHEGTQSDNQT